MTCSTSEPVVLYCRHPWTSGTNGLLRFAYYVLEESSLVRTNRTDRWQCSARPLRPFQQALASIFRFPDPLA
jgi:hypothetical protein